MTTGSVDLRTTWLGMELRNPIVASSSPLTGRIDGLRALEDAGVGAVVLPSLFEEQLMLDLDSLLDSFEEGRDSFLEAQSYFPEVDAHLVGPEKYLALVAEAKAALSIPVIASLNGHTPGGWVRFAEELEEAGADAIELNIYMIEPDPNVSGSLVEDRYVSLVRELRAAVGVPLAVKLAPFFTSPGHLFRRLAAEGADGLVLFNRFYQPDFDLDALEVRPSLQLSRSEELRLRLRWVAMLYGRLPVGMAITGGIHDAVDLLKALMAGANAGMVASAVLQHGPGLVGRMLGDLTNWMLEREYDSVRQMIGSLSQISCPDARAFERANYLKTLSSYVMR
jgi:dihydroorotate dehydrogenase (fumarate)